MKHFISFFLVWIFRASFVCFTHLLISTLIIHLFYFSFVLSFLLIYSSPPWWNILFPLSFVCFTRLKKTFLCPLFVLLIYSSHYSLLIYASLPWWNIIFPCLSFVYSFTFTLTNFLISTSSFLHTQNLESLILWRVYPSVRIIFCFHVCNKQIEQNKNKQTNAYKNNK